MSHLWTQQHEANRRAAEPLAVRLRPRRRDEFVGQRHFLGPGKLLSRMLDADRLTSLLFHGPPGTGKTSLAELIAAETGRQFEMRNAALIGVKEVRQIISDATRRLEESRRRTILFIDEIHRFARNQQDVLLHAVETGRLTLIGATTENPSFAVNAALVSRSTLLRFEPLGEEDVADLLSRAVRDERSFPGLEVVLHPDAIAHWTRICDGDARRALTALEVAVLSQAPEAGGRVEIDRACAEESIQAKALVYDGTGDEHYDVISVFIKSMRGGDPDAAVHWLARMLEAGEDPRFIARRLAIFASEDVGNADPTALTLAAAAWEVAERVGLPECGFALAQAALYLACAPKSRATADALGAAREDVRTGRTRPVPAAYRDDHYAGARAMGHGGDAAASAPGFGVDRVYYRPSGAGFEEHLEARLEQRRVEPPSSRSAGSDVTDGPDVTDGSRGADERGGDA